MRFSVCVIFGDERLVPLAAGGLGYCLLRDVVGSGRMGGLVRNLPGTDTRSGYGRIYLLLVDGLLPVDVYLSGLKRRITGFGYLWEEEILLPSYPIGLPEKTPMFLEKRVYQGSSGVVYPYPVIERIGDTCEKKPFRGEPRSPRIPRKQKSESHRCHSLHSCSSSWT